MVEDASTVDLSTVKDEMDEALSKLDLSLLEAGRSISIVRNKLGRLMKLAEHAGEMEAAIARAREQLNISFDATTAFPLRALPLEEPDDEPEPVLEPGAAAADVHERDDVKAPRSHIAPHAKTAVTSRCLRLSVKKKSGNLDLKEVDGSVNENSSVIDVALLDYDGRKATLKLWVNEKSDPEGVRDALLSSLRNHLGEKDTEVHIEFEKHSAA